MPASLHLYIAAEEDAEAIAAGEYEPAPGSAVALPADIDEDGLAALNGLLAGCRIAPDLSAIADELLAEGEEAFVYRALPEFVERLARLGEEECREMARRWADFLSRGEDDEGWSTEAKVRPVLRRLSGLARRARGRDLPVFVAVPNSR